MRDLAKALLSLRPGAVWTLEGNDYDNIQWMDKIQKKPYQSEITAEMDRQESEWNATEYRRLREREYPSIQQQMDMQYWDSVNGTTTWQDAINAVKAKYPKP